MIQEIVGAGERASSLTRQLLAFSRKSIVEPKIVDPVSLVTDLDKLLRRVVGEDIELSVMSSGNVGVIQIDPGQFEQVIMNMVVNARDAMPKGGFVTIELQNINLDESYIGKHPDAIYGPHVLIAITDSGIGMDAVTQSRIFEPFFTTKGEHGTGLGLATAHGIIKQAGGQVSVYSELGKGTTFKIYLPRIDSPAQTIKKDSKPISQGSESILLVEDEEMVRSLSKHILISLGYRVTEATNGEEALALVEKPGSSFRLLITDVVMPKIGGRELANQLKQKFPDLKVLFLSGYTDDAVVRHGILQAEVAFLQKPFTPALLAAKVRETLDSTQTG
jgi:CheY-like chemotaxis protein